MVTVMDPPGPWGQASSCCFFLGGLFADILLIRIFLFLAYTFLLTNALCGFPSWPDYESTGRIEISTIVWSCMNLIVHGSAIARLVSDERPVKFKTEDEKQMRSFFGRRGGMGSLEVKEVLRRGKFRKVKAGEIILDKLQAIETFVLLVEGKAHCNRKDEDGLIRSLNFYSGMGFDVGLLNVFGVYIGFEKKGSFEVVADIDCTVFEWSIYSLNDLACKCGPAVSNYFRNFILFTVSSEWEFRTQSEPRNIPARTSRGTREPMEYLEGKRSLDFVKPLEDWEIRKLTFLGVLKWIWSSLEPFMPPGTRHNALPNSGTSAKTRIMSIERVKASVLGQEEDTGDEKGRNNGFGEDEC